MFGLNPEDLLSIIAVLKRYRDVEEALIFGSRAMGNYKPGSDVDIALKGPLPTQTVTDISAELNERIPLPYKFDVVAYNDLSDQPLIAHINTYGKSFYHRTGRA